MAGNSLEYQLPYYDVAPDDPTIEDMRLIVCKQKLRPHRENAWDNYDVCVKRALRVSLEM